MKSGIADATSSFIRYEQLGKDGSFANVDFGVALDGEIWTIENGNLYRTDARTLAWIQIGKSGENAGPGSVRLRPGRAAIGSRRRIGAG